MSRAGSAALCTLVLVGVACSAPTAGPGPSVGAVGANEFVEDFTWEGIHAATINGGHGSTVWWDPDDWDVHADTHANGIAAESSGYDNLGHSDWEHPCQGERDDTTGECVDGFAPLWPWRGHHVDIHKSTSPDPRDGHEDNDDLIPGGDGSPGVGIMHLDFQGIVGSRLRNPMLIGTEQTASVSFFAPLFQTTGAWWEVAISPTAQVTGTEYTAVPARDFDDIEGENLPSPLSGSGEGGTNGPGHHLVTEDSINVLAAGYPDIPDCVASTGQPRHGWHVRFVTSRNVDGVATYSVNEVPSMDDLVETDPSEINDLYPWQITYEPGRIVLRGDVDEDGAFEVHGDWPVDVPWDEVYVHVLAAAYQADHHPQWGCGYNQDGNGVTQVREIAWKDIHVSPVRYAHTMTLPRQQPTGPNDLRTDGWLEYDIRDIQRYGPDVAGQPQPNDHDYDKDQDHNDYAYCSPQGITIYCDPANPYGTVTDEVELTLDVAAEDIADLRRAQLVLDIRGGDDLNLPSPGGTVTASINGTPVGVFGPIDNPAQGTAREAAFEATAWVRRSHDIPLGTLVAGTNTVTLELSTDALVYVDRIELELARGDAAPPDPNDDPPTAPPAAGAVTRLSGPTRIETAAAVSHATVAAGADVVYMATARDFPDALAGGPAAGRDRGPILLVEPDALPQATADELARIRPGRIVILGGTNAVGAAVEQALGPFTPGPVERLSGPERYATAAAIAGTFATPVAVAYVATGTDFPDALAGGAAAARDGAPILLTQPDRLPQSTADQLAALSPGRIVVLGGESAVSAAVEAELREFAPTDRVSGPDRFGTAAAVAATFGSPQTRVYVATGASFPDALAGTPAAARTDSPLLLVRQGDIPAAIASQLDRLGPATIVILGGTAAVSAAVADQLEPFIA